MGTRVIQVEKTIYTCDECGKDVEQYGYICHGCRRRLCRACAGAFMEDPIWGEDVGDYTIWMCKRCSKSVKPYSARAKKILEAAYDRVTELEDEWMSQ